MVGDAAAAVGLDDVDALGAVPVLAHRQLAGLRAAPARVHRRVLEQQQEVTVLVRLAGGSQAVLEPDRGAVLHGAEIAHELRRKGVEVTPRSTL